MTPSLFSLYLVSFKQGGWEVYVPPSLISGKKIVLASLRAHNLFSLF